MNNVIITPVSENTTPTGMGLLGEHGLAFHINNNGEEILFDTGQGLVLENNLNFLGKDISSTKKVILSHGHYDHTGGLKAVADKTSFELFSHPASFLPKLVSYDRENYFNIGCPVSEDYLKEKGIKLNFSDKSEKIASNIVTTGEVEFTNDFEEVEALFYTDKDGEKVKDTIPDDLGIIIDTPAGNVLVLGCTHRGIINTLDHVSEITGSKEFHTVIGGLHLGGADEEKMDLIIKRLSDFKIQNLVTGHCTGKFAQVKLASSNSVSHSFIALGAPYTF
jgi:7,8-dihydropterin-6-yl-methyl-4-(beta-D-ribofuranosyl)aminobenzene 5'-phosphate synthase